MTVDLATRRARIVAVRAVSLERLNRTFQRANEPFRATVLRERDF